MEALFGSMLPVSERHYLVSMKASRLPVRFRGCRFEVSGSMKALFGLDEDIFRFDAGIFWFDVGIFWYD